MYCLYCLNTNEFTNKKYATNSMLTGFLGLFLSHIMLVFIEPSSKVILFLFFFFYFIGSFSILIGLILFFIFNCYLLNKNFSHALTSMIIIGLIIILYIIGNIITPKEIPKKEKSDLTHSQLVSKAFAKPMQQSQIILEEAKTVQSFFYSFIISLVTFILTIYIYFRMQKTIIER